MRPIIPAVETKAHTRTTGMSLLQAPPQPSKPSSMEKTTIVPAAVEASKEFLYSMSAVLRKQELFLANMRKEKQQWEKERDSLRHEVDDIKKQLEYEEDSDDLVEEEELQGLKERLQALKTEFAETTEGETHSGKPEAVLKVSKHVHFEPKEVEILRHDLNDEHENYLEELEKLRQELAEVKSSREEIQLLRRELEEAKAPVKQEIDNILTELTVLRQGEEEVSQYEEESLYSEYEVVTVSDAGSNCFDAVLDSSCCSDASYSEESSSTASMTSVADSIYEEQEIGSVEENSGKLSLPSIVEAPNSPVSVVPDSPVPVVPDSPVSVVETPKRCTGNRLPSLGPLSVEALSHAQRKDKLLKAFLHDHRSLPYSFKNLKIQDAQTSSGDTLHLVMFHKRWYIPDSLRDSALDYLVTHADADDALQQKFIWPFCEASLMERQIR